MIFVGREYSVFLLLIFFENIFINLFKLFPCRLDEMNQSRSDPQLSPLMSPSPVSRPPSDSSESLNQSFKVNMSASFTRYPIGNIDIMSYPKIYLFIAVHEGIGNTASWWLYLQSVTKIRGRRTFKTA